MDQMMRAISNNTPVGVTETVLVMVLSIVMAFVLDIAIARRKK